MGLLSMARRESQFLKLVHAGGFVELHVNPIMASEIMNKNPRHYVTRPDFFQFPWIVVNPESILTPGNVFYIVPCHTIRHKMKSTNTLLPNQIHQDHRRRSECKIRCFQKHSSVSKQGNWAQSSFTGKLAVYYSSDAYTSSDSGKLKVRSRSGGRFSHNSDQTLKPCLKKDKTHSTARSRRNLKVRFDCNDDNSANFTTKKIYRHS